jgi:uncharacterized protein with GYD domain
MPHYIILSNLTDEGRRTIKQKPERILEVNKEIEAMGIKIHKQYALLGSYDFINIVEAPNNEAVISVGRDRIRGSVHLMTLLPYQLRVCKKIKYKSYYLQKLDNYGMNAGHKLRRHVGEVSNYC